MNYNYYMTLLIHQNIHNKLDFFIKENKIPHIIFYGPSGSGKRTILNEFINDIYQNDKQKLNQYVMHVNCAHSKGIRFIRDELKFFAKTNIHNKNNNLFKSIVLFNADQLTIDAQSALRRCIEQFSHTTRFFILVNNVNRLLKPILSKICLFPNDREIFFKETKGFLFLKLLIRNFLIIAILFIGSNIYFFIFIIHKNSGIFRD